MYSKNSNGITLITLVVTIIVLIILASVTVEFGKTGIAESKEKKLISELGMVQHALLERYTKWNLTKDDSILPSASSKMEYAQVEAEFQKIGETPKITYDNLSSINSIKCYYKLTESDLELLGIDKTTDTYIVNFETGEVFNQTKIRTDSGEKLYVYSSD